MSLKKFEYYDTGRDTATGVYGSGPLIWIGQQFTPSETHFINSLRLPLYKAGNPGDVIVKVRLYSAPSVNLSVGSLEASSLTALSDPILYTDVDLDSPVLLTAGVQYLICLPAPGTGDVADMIAWHADADGSYTGGDGVWSNNGGVTWQNINPDLVFLFEEWGTYDRGSAGELKVLLDSNWSTLDGYLPEPTWLVLNDDNALRFNLSSGDVVLLRADSPTRDITNRDSWKYIDTRGIAKLELYTKHSRQRLYDLKAGIRDILHANLNAVPGYGLVKYQGFSEEIDDELNIWSGVITVQLETHREYKGGD